MRRLLHVVAEDLLFRLEYTTFLANQLTVADIEKELPIHLEFQEFGKEVLRSLRTTQGKEGGVLHLQDGYNDLEEEIGRNVGTLIDNDNVGSGTTGRLKGGERKLVTL